MAFFVSESGDLTAPNTKMAFQLFFYMRYASPPGSHTAFCFYAPKKFAFLNNQTRCPGLHQNPPSPRLNRITENRIDKQIPMNPYQKKVDLKYKALLVNSVGL